MVQGVDSGPDLNGRTVGADAQALAQAALDLYTQHSSIQLTSEAVTTAAVRLIHRADGASVALLAGNGTVRSNVSTDALAAAMQGIQDDVGEGPTRQSLRTRETVLVCDLRDETRWTRFTSAAVENTEARSVLALALCAGTDVLGALTVHSRAIGAFSAHAVAGATALAAHCALALMTSTHEEQFARALASRDAIGQAKGMIMERYNIDAQQAFAMLSTISQNTNTPVKVLAERLTSRR